VAPPPGRAAPALHAGRHGQAEREEAGMSVEERLERLEQALGKAQEVVRARAVAALDGNGPLNALNP